MSSSSFSRPVRPLLFLSLCGWLRHPENASALLAAAASGAFFGISASHCSASWTLRQASPDSGDCKNCALACATYCSIRVIAIHCNSRLGGLRPHRPPPAHTVPQNHGQRKSKLGGLRPPRPPRPPLTRPGLQNHVMPRSNATSEPKKLRVFRIQCKSRLGGLRPPRPPRHTRSHKTTVQRRSGSKLHSFSSL